MMNVQGLKKALDEKGISQNELARRCGVCSATMSFIFSGKREPKVPMLKAICRELGVSPERIW